MPGKKTSATGMLPDRNFKAETVTPKMRLRDARVFDDYTDPVFQEDITDLVIETTPLKSCKWADLYAYMNRRFGLPFVGSDDYKDLCGSWLLTTPAPDVFVQVLPSLSGPFFSFTPYVASEVLQHERQPVLPKERREEIAAAYRATLLDLLRPVCVRDSHFNALGVVEDGSRLMKYDNRKEEGVYEVKYHSSAGNVIPPGLLGGEDWGQFCALIRHLGDGDYAAGRSATVDVLKAKALEGFRKEPLEVRILAAAGLRNAYSTSLLSVRDELDEETMLRIAAISDGLDKPNKPDMLQDDMHFDDATVARAAAISRILEPRSNLVKEVNDMRLGRLLEAEWENLKQAAGDDDFPDDCIPESWPTGKDVQTLPARLREAGAEKIASWSERVLAGPDGETIVGRTLAALCVQRQKAQQAAGPKP